MSEKNTFFLNEKPVPLFNLDDLLKGYNPANEDNIWDEKRGRIMNEFIERACNFACENIDADDSPGKGFLIGVEFILKEMHFLDEEVRANIVRDIAYDLYEHGDCDCFWDSSDFIG